MRLCLAAAAALSIFGCAPACAHPARFEHIVLVVQENRTPDNLFHALCATQRCSTTAHQGAYDIQTGAWRDKSSGTGHVEPRRVALASGYDLGHMHDDFNLMCDEDRHARTCRMDGAAAIGCRPESSCPPRPQFRYVDNASEILSPYLELATQYGWANEMFQTNQGPSFPAHQFLFGATSAPSREDDRKGVFVSENLPGTGQPDTPPDNGCMARKSARIQLIDPNGTESTQNRIYPCLEHRTVADLLDDHGLEWRYFAPGAGNLWTAPDAISHLCQPRKRQCTGEEWQKHLVLKPARVLDEIRHCRLAQVSWIIPSGQESDHAFLNRGLGPSWVASIVNEIGNSACRDNNGARFWNSTAIVVVWDDWGGWYDHEAPSLLRYPQGGYQYGFRVPLLFISAYTQKGYINDERLDFGSIVRFVEHNFGIRKGELTFADARAHGDLGHFYDLAAHPRPFKTIKAPRTADFFLHDTAPLTPPDDD